MAWILLLVAGLFEVVWVYFMKLSEGFTRPLPAIATIAAMLVSFGLLAHAMRSLPMGTSYMVWTGIGALGAFAVGVMMLGESAGTLRLVAAGLILAGIVLMKLASP